MPRVLLFAFILLFSFYNSKGQTIDEVDALINKGLYMEEDKKDSLVLLAHEVRKQSESIGYEQGALYYYRFLGWVAEYNSKLDSAIYFYLQMQKKALEGNFNSEYLQAVNDLGSVYIRSRQYEAAEKIFQNGLDLTDSTANPRRKAAFYNNLGIALKRQEKLKEASKAYDASLKIKYALKDTNAIVDQIINTSSLLITLGEYNKARQLIQEAFGMTDSKEIANEWHLSLNFAEAAFLQNRISEAKLYADKAQDISLILEAKDKLAETYLLKSRIEEKKNNFSEALSLERQAHQLIYENVNQESNAEINQLREQYEAEKREKENALLNETLKSEKQKQLYFWLGILFLFTLLGTTAYAYNKNQKKNKQLQLQNNLIESQKQLLTKLNEDKNELISIVSHDLRSPFNAIKLWVDSLVQNLDKSPMKVSESIESIQKMAQYGENLIDDILDVEKIDVNTHQLDLHKFHLTDLLNELIADFEPASEGKNINISFINDSKNTLVLSDPKLIRRACENLISNALKYSPSHTDVQIKLSETKVFTVIDVIDQGPGIDVEDQKGLFQKYARSKNRTTSNEASTGLGLSIVRRIMDELGGEVSCKSEVGKGSTFTLKLKKVLPSRQNL